MMRKRSQSERVTWPDTAKMPIAMGRSYAVPSFRRSAGDRLMMILPRGRQTRYCESPSLRALGFLSQRYRAGLQWHTQCQEKG